MKDHLASLLVEVMLMMLMLMATVICLIIGASWLFALNGVLFVVMFRQVRRRYTALYAYIHEKERTS